MITAIAELEEQKWNEGNLAGREEGFELAYQIMQTIKKNPKWSNKKVSKECNCSVKMVAKVRDGLES